MYLIRERAPTRADIRAVREKLDLSLDELAFLLGVAPEHLAAWESGERWPDVASRLVLDTLNEAPDSVFRAVLPRLQYLPPR